LQGEEELFGAL